MQSLLDYHPYIQELLALNATHQDRKAFHEASVPLLKKMGDDKDFINQVIQRNFEDEGYLNQQWSLYNIPFSLRMKRQISILRCICLCL